MRDVKPEELIHAANEGRKLAELRMRRENLKEIKWSERRKEVEEKEDSGPTGRARG